RGARAAARQGRRPADDRRPAAHALARHRCLRQARGSLAEPNGRLGQSARGPRVTDVRKRVLAPVLLVLAVTAGGFAVTQIEAAHDAPLVLAVGLAAAAIAGT